MASPGHASTTPRGTNIKILAVMIVLLGWGGTSKRVSEKLSLASPGINHATGGERKLYL
jgi:hypothetical protein